MKTLTVLRVFLSLRDYVYMAGLAAFACILSVLETICLSAVMPFLLLALNKDSHVASSFLQYFPIPVGRHIFFLGLLLIAVFAMRAGAASLFSYLLYRFAQQKFKAIANVIFQNYMASPYQDYLHWNSAALLKMATNDPFHVGVIIPSLLLAIAELCVVITMYGMLLWVNWKITVIVTFLLFLLSVSFFNSLFGRIKKYGEQNGIFLRQLTQVFNEGFGNFKMIRLAHVEGMFVERFDNAVELFSQAYAYYSMLQNMLRLILESVTMILLIGGTLALVYVYGDQAAHILLSAISFFGIAFYRLVPAINRLMSCYGQMSFSLNSIGIYDEKLLKANTPNEDMPRQSIDFRAHLAINNLSFAYLARKPVISSLSMTIERGASIGIVGKSGAGKSTLIDILLGLHEPTGGCLIVDDVILTKNHMYAWQEKIGYIPQHVYLFEGTVADNVTFGRAVDRERLISCLTRAQMWDTLVSKDGLETQVGEGGSQLSGGQRQRIALARALYGNPEILILDEATSALDKETEALVYQDIFQAAQEKTLIIVTHRTEMTTQCDYVYELREGKAFMVGGKKAVVRRDLSEGKQVTL